MAKGWPFEEFREYLLTLMDVAGIRDYAELSRLSGVNQNQFSNWRRGLSQPSSANLRKIAPALGVKPIKLFLAAGLNDADELDLSAQPDFTVLPVEIQDLINLYVSNRLNGEQQTFLRRSVANLTAGLRAELTASPAIRPSGRRRAG